MLPLVALIAVLIFLAAAGAGVFPWTVCLAALLLCVACAATAWRRRESVPDPHRLRLRHAWVALLAFLLLTLVPLPRPLTRLTGAERRQQNDRVSEILHDAVRVVPTPAHVPWFSLTRSRAGTLRMAILALAAFSAATLAASLSARGKVVYLRFLLLGGAALGAAGYVAQYLVPQGDTLWWIINVPKSLPGPVTCFVNRNHYAGFLALLAPVALGLFVRDVLRKRGLAALLSMAAMAVLMAAVALSLSRGAMVACAAGLAVALVLLLARGRSALPALAVLALCGAAAAYLLTAHPAAGSRLESLRDIGNSDSLTSRTSAWKDALRIWRAYPVTGAGANALRAVYPQFRATSAREFTAHVENEYVEVLADTGVVGALIAVLLLAAALASRAPPPPPDRAQSDRALTAGLLGAAAAAAVHALGDFALHAPLYAITLASLAGLLFDPDACWFPDRRRAALPMVNLLLAATLCLSWRTMTQADSRAHLVTATLSEARRAVVWAPTSPEAWYALGAALQSDGGTAATPLAARCLAQAGAYDPNNYRLWFNIGKFRLATQDYTGARQAFARVLRLRPWMSTEIPRVPEK